MQRPSRNDVKQWRSQRRGGAVTNARSGAGVCGRGSGISLLVYHVWRNSHGVATHHEMYAAVRRQQ